MKLTAESTVINDSKLNNNIDNAQTTADGARVIADEAKTIADDTAQFFWFTSTGDDTGAHISEKTRAEFETAPSGGNLLARSNGIAVRDGLTELATFGATATIGKIETYKPRIELASNGMKILVRTSDNTDIETTNLAYDTANDGSSYDNKYPFFTFGTRASGSDIGAWSFAEGGSHTASGAYSHAEGYGSTASSSFSHAEGYKTTAKNFMAHAQNEGTIAAGSAQTAIGRYNIEDATSLLIVGNGTSGARANAFSIASNGTVYVNGTSVHSSDRRLKEHMAYLGDEAVEFIDGLKPAHYIKDGKKHVGFYAQDVKEVDKWDCMLGEEMNGYMTLSYMDLIAPLVKYVQKLEKRIEELERDNK